MSYYMDHWTINHFVDPQEALHFAGSRFKVYSYRTNVFVNVGEDDTVRLNFLYAINTNKDETTFELLYKMCRGNVRATEEWHPVPIEVIENLFKDENGEWDFCSMFSSGRGWEKNTKIETVNGHFLLKYNTRWLRDILGSVSVSSMNYSVPGKLVHERDDNLGVAIVYHPEKKYTFSDTTAILQALNSIKSVSWTLAETEESQMTWRKKRMFDQLEKAKKDLAEYERKYQEILDKAADAMNLMSDKYGIEVEI